jgi:protein gp37
MARRLQAMGSPNYKNGFKVTLHPHLLQLPMKWKRPQIIFVNSMSDLFHDEVPDSFIFDVFLTMHRAEQHIFQVLTKRPERLAKLNDCLPWSSNIWMGVTIEDKDNIIRADFLRSCSASTRFLSCEPLLGSLRDISLNGIDWVIVGGESGPGARPICSEWILELKQLCAASNVPFFFKQWGGFNKKKNGRVLEGRVWNDMPSSINRLCAYSNHCRD